MKRTVGATVIFVGLAVFALGPTAATAGGTRCNGLLGGVTINGNLVAGPGCNLADTTVNGNVTVTPGGSLSTGPTTVIKGNVQSRGATSVDISGWVGGSVVIDGTTGAGGGVSVIRSGTVQGNIEIRNSLPPAVVYSEFVGGSVKLHHNVGSASFIPVGEAVVQQSTVRGSVEIYDNRLTGANLNLAWVLFNTIGGNLKIDHNSSTGGSQSNLVQAQSNSVGGNVEVSDNTVSGPAGSVSTVRIAINAITGNLVCRNNNPAVAGGANTAKQKKGECAGL